MRALLRRIGLRGWLRCSIAAGVLFAAMSIGTVEYTSRSSFCSSCHIMEPYYASWQRGAHKDIACVKCHISPGVNNFFTAKLNGLGQVVDDALNRTSTKPSASVDQLACTRPGCHSLEKVRATRKTEGSYLFRHDKHVGVEVDGIMLACGTCHSHIKGGEHFEVNTNVCVTCHLLERDPDGHGLARGPEGGNVSAVIRMAVREGRPGEPGGGGAAIDAAGAAEQSPVKAADGERNEAAAEAGSGEPSPAPKVVALSPGSDSAPSTQLRPPSNCATCHTPPRNVLQVGSLKVDHAQYLSYGAACESCHRGTTATPDPIEDSRCLECHTFGIDRTLPLEQMHRVHSEGRHKIECFSCHGTVRHGPTAQTASLEQFDCRRCHQDQHSVQRKTYLTDGAPVHVPGAPPAVSPMFLAHVDCTGCHTQARAVSVKPDSGATVATATAQACDRCHKPGLGEQMIPLWQKTTRSLYDQLAADLAAAEAQAEPAAPDVLDETRRLLELVRIDGSWGVHNPRYTQQLLEKAREKLAATRAASPGGPKE